MKFSVAILLNILLAYTCYLYSDLLPWWIFMIGAFLVGLAIPQGPGWRFLSAFLGVFICWFIITWQINGQNQDLLAGKMAQVLKMGHSPMLLMGITAFLGGLLAAFASWSGGYLRRNAQPSAQ